MSSSTKTNQTSTLSQTTMPVAPSNVTGAINSQLSNITALGNVPATSYVAPQSSLQNVANSQGAGLLTGTNPNYGTGASDIQGNSSVSPSQISSFLSPYLSNVLGTTNAAMAQSAGQQDAALEAQGAASGAFGGSRFGVAQGVLGGQQQLALGQTDANIENTGYQSAVSNALSNAQLGQTAGVNLGNLATQQGATNVANVAELANLGASQQATAQAQAAAPIALAQAQAGLLAGLPLNLVSGSTTNGDQNTQSSSTSTNPMQIISGLASLAGAGLTGGASLAGLFAPAATGAASSLNMGFANS